MTPRVHARSRAAAGVLVAALLGLPGAEAAADDPAPRRVRSLERALIHVAETPDPVEALAVSRGITTALLELTCAIGLLLPDAGEPLDPVDGVLGAGCLVAAIGLFVSSGLRLSRLGARQAHRARLAAFRLASTEGRIDEALLRELEEGLFEAEADTRRERAIGVTLGVGSLVAAGVVGGLTAAGRIDRRTGTAVAAGAFVVGGLGITVAFLESPAERAATVHRRLGLVTNDDRRPEAAVVPALWPGWGVGLAVTGRW